MKRVFLLAILVMACGCKRSDYAGSEGSATLSFSPSFSAGNAADNADSRATATSFEDGDQVGVYVVKQGQSLRSEFNAIDNHLFRYFAEGDSLGSVPMAMYYPYKTTPVAVYAYYPYYSGSGGERFSALAMPFIVAEDQKSEITTTSDLCLSQSDFAAPSASPRSLTFYHALSQVVVNVDYSAVADVDSLYSVKFIDVKRGVSVNLGDGVLTLQDAPSFVIIDSVAILPPQTFAPSKLIEIQVRMKDQTLANYYFNPVTPITIEAKKCNTLKLALRSGSDRAELTSALAISPWIGGTGNGQMTERVGNDFTLIYLNPKLSFREVTRVVLTINETEYEATDVTIKDNGDKSAKIGFMLRGNAPREYPYTVTAIKLFVKESLLLNITDRISSPEVYKSGEKVLAYGAFTPPSVTIAGTKWCSTNLTGMREGNESLVIACDKPEEYGMYFKWGCSQVYAHVTNNTDGIWDGTLTGGAATFPATTHTGGLGYDYGQIPTGGTSPGDPCLQLGPNYKVPTRQQFIDLAASRNNTPSNPFQQLNGVKGMFFGTGAQNITGNQNYVPDGMIFLPASGHRDYGGPTYNEAYQVFYSVSTTIPYDPNLAYDAYFTTDVVEPSAIHGRSLGLAVRCVEDARLIAVMPAPNKMSANDGTIGITLRASAGIAWTATLTGNTGATGFTFTNGTASMTGTGAATITVRANVNPGAERSTTLRVTSGSGANAIYSEVPISQLIGTGPISTVAIAGTQWMTSNLTGVPGQDATISVCAQPEIYGMYFKWGSTHIYARANSTTDGLWDGSMTGGGATAPANTNTGGLGYDYAQGLFGGTAPGDPCKRLGAAYRTPTRQQFIDLFASRGNVVANPLQQLRGINGYFFGPGAQNVSGNQATVPYGMIFLPTPGHRNYTGGMYGMGFAGMYWSSSVYNSDFTYLLQFNVTNDVDDFNHSYLYGRALGQAVRCVEDSPVPTISFSPAAPAVIPSYGTGYTIALASNTTWAAGVGTNCIVNVTSGVNGTLTWIQVPRSETNVTRQASITFTTTTNNGYPAATTTWQATQAAEPAPTISFSPAAPADQTSKDGSSHTITMASNTTWSVIGTPVNCSVNTTSGSNGTQTTITIPKSTSSTTTATSITFATTTNYGHPATAATWSATQAAAIYSDANVQEINGVKWCKRNLTGTPGQSTSIWMTANPQDYGSYFKWQDSYVFSSTSTWNGYDNVVPGDPCKKLGSNYRTPTNAEHISLNNSGANLKCQLNNVKGAFFGPGAAYLGGNQSSVPANMIFIPTAGLRDNSSGVLNYAGYTAWVWSSSPQSAAGGYYLYFDYNGSVNPSSSNSRAYGLSVRCVQE